MRRRLSKRAGLRVLVLLGGWGVFVATSNVDRTFELELDGAIPVRDGQGGASVVFDAFDLGLEHFAVRLEVAP